MGDITVKQINKGTKIILGGLVAITASLILVDIRYGLGRGEPATTYEIGRSVTKHGGTNEVETSLARENGQNWIICNDKTVFMPSGRVDQEQRYTRLGGKYTYSDDLYRISD